MALFNYLLVLLLSVVARATDPTPPAPGLTFLYTSFVTIATPIDLGVGPHGDRLTIPITGGNFTGPRLSGTILDIGADWGTVDVQTGIFSPDTRYNFKTNDGAEIWVRSTGSALTASPTSDSHLRLIYETGSRTYYWLNNIITIGILKVVSVGTTSSVLRIDTWHMTSDVNTTVFL